MAAQEGGLLEGGPGLGPRGHGSGSHQWSYQQREVHNHTCVLMPGTCLEQVMPTRRLPIQGHLHIHTQPWTQRPTDIPLVHSQRTHTLQPSKPYWALATNSHDNMPSILSREARTGLGPPGGPSSLWPLLPSAAPAPTLEVGCLETPETEVEPPAHLADSRPVHRRQLPLLGHQRGSSQLLSHHLAHTPLVTSPQPGRQPQDVQTGFPV